MRLIPTVIPLGYYYPMRGPLHGVRVPVKLAGIVLFVLAGALFITSPIVAGGYALVVLAAYILARIPLSVAWSQLWPALPLLVALSAFQWWQRGPAVAATLLLVLGAALLAACLLTVTTTIGELLDGITTALEPFRRYGVPVERIGLLLSLTLRLIPLQLQAVTTVLEARRARGAGMGLMSFITPVIVRSLRRADAIAEALWARGAGDDPRDDE